MTGLFMRMERATPADARQSCFEKVRYTTKTGARDGAARRKDLGLSFYRCEVCNGWHLTRAPKSAQRKIKAAIRRRARG